MGSCILVWDRAGMNMFSKGQCQVHYKRDNVDVVRIGRSKYMVLRVHLYRNSFDELNSYDKRQGP